MKGNLIDSFATAEEAAAACSNRILEAIRQAVEQRGRASMAVSGGSTPKLLFQELAKADFPWEKLAWFFVDERIVPASDPESNYHLAHENFFEKVGFPKENAFRVQTENGVDAASRQYSDAIRNYFQSPPGELPVFDLVQLGLGPDGHTGSLFPGDPLVRDRTGITAAVRTAPKPPPERVTMLPGLLLAARWRVFLLAGEDKHDALRAVLSGDEDVMRYPAQVISRAGSRVEWFVGGISGID